MCGAVADPGMGWRKEHFLFNRVFKKKMLSIIHTLKMIPEQLQNIINSMPSYPRPHLSIIWLRILFNTTIYVYTN